MKNFCIVCAAMVLAATLVATASAGEHGVSIPTSTLNSMGFAGVQILSDNDGLAVRGKGTFANVWGESVSNYNNRYGQNSSVNGYEAGADHRYGSSTAVGTNLSYAGNKTSFGRFGGISVNFAGGGSSGYAR